MFEDCFDVSPSVRISHVSTHVCLKIVLMFPRLYVLDMFLHMFCKDCVDVFPSVRISHVLTHLFLKDALVLPRILRFVMFRHMFFTECSVCLRVVHVVGASVCRMYLLYAVLCVL